MMRKNTSRVWKDFNKLSENEVECKICQVKLKYNGSSTSSMIKHLKLIHNKYPEQSLHTQPSLSTFGFTPGRSCNESRQNMITNLIASMVAEHNLPLLLPEWDGFRKLMAFVEPNYKPTCANTIKSRIKQEAEIIKNKIKLELKNINYLALTTDAWTSVANESFMAVTAAFITKKWEILSPVLETINLTERHTTNYLSEILKKTCEEWQICSKVEAIVHDNASNVCKIASVISEGADIGCAAHTLQLCINDAMGTKTVSNHPISRVVNAASHLVGHFNHSCLATNEMIKRQRSMKPEDEPKKLIQYCKTRWNSIYDMFERLDELRWPIVAVLSDSRYTKPSDATALCLKEEQWSLIQSLIPILKQLKIANTLFCGEEYVSISIVYPVLYPLINKHLNLTENDNLIIKTFKIEMKEQLQRRFFNNIIIKAAIASALDPRFRNLDFFPDDYKQIIKKEITNLSGSFEMSETLPFLPSCQNPTKEDPESEDEESAFFGSTNNRIDEPKKITFAEEYENFSNSSPISRKECPLLWWKENENIFPRLSQMAKKFLCVPATSVASERHFSAAGRVITKQRSRLLPETSQALLFVNRNRGYMNLPEI